MREEEDGQLDFLEKKKKQKIKENLRYKYHKQANKYRKYKQSYPNQYLKEKMIEALKKVYKREK